MLAEAYVVCTAQAMGENVLGAVPELARTLARHEIKPEAEYNANAVYFDLFGLYMVRILSVSNMICG
jgi:hypothetical protein